MSYSESAWIGEEVDFQNSQICSGYGSKHTSNPYKNTKKEYFPINLLYLESLVKTPHDVPKNDAQWAIFSNIHNEYGRNKKYILNHAFFYCLWADIDSCELSIDQLQEKLNNEKFYAIIYTTKSSTDDEPRYRIIIPLSHSIKTQAYLYLQNMINEIFRKYSIWVDSCNTRCNQICFLPNRGEYYDYRILNHPVIDPRKFTKQINYFIEAQKKSVPPVKPYTLENTQLKSFSYSQKINVLNMFKELHNLEKLMTQFGYKQIGDRWLSPLSKSGYPGVVINENQTWTSFHNSDLQANIGKIKSENGEQLCYGDVFDIFCFFKHDNSFKKALIEAGNKLILPNGQTANQHNQALYFKGLG